MVRAPSAGCIPCTSILQLLSEVILLTLESRHDLIPTCTVATSVQAPSVKSACCVRLYTDKEQK